MNLAIVQYTDNVPAPHGGVTYGPWVRILPKYKGDAGLLAHELVHVKQFWVGLLAAAPWLYTLATLQPSDALRVYAVAVGMLVVGLFAIRKRLILMAEVDAYQVQLTYAPTAALIFAGFISTRYGLDITPDAALKLLTD